jgi:hypothetical protein
MFLAGFKYSPERNQSLIKDGIDEENAIALLASHFIFQFTESFVLFSVQNYEDVNRVLDSVVGAILDVSSNKLMLTIHPP